MDDSSTNFITLVRPSIIQPSTQRDLGTGSPAPEAVTENDMPRESPLSQPTGRPERIEAVTIHHGNRNTRESIKEESSNEGQQMDQNHTPAHP